jgi:hypothetical protein
VCPGRKPLLEPSGVTLSWFESVTIPHHNDVAALEEKQSDGWADSLTLFARVGTASIVVAGTGTSCITQQDP